MSRRQVREKALQTLYQLELNPDAGRSTIDHTAHGLKKEVREEDVAFFLRLTQRGLEKPYQVDPIIQRYLKEDWTVPRLSIIDRSILRLAAFELLFEPDIPEGVTLNEAVELAKRFSTGESARYINGVLGTLVKDLDSIQKEIAGE